MANLDGDHTNTIQIVSWLMMAVMILMFGLRMIAKITSKKQAGNDDLLAVLAMASGIGSTVALSSAANAGLGNTNVIEDAAALRSIEQAIYAASLLYFTTIWLAKLSTLILLVRLCSNWRRPRLIWTSTVIVLIWGLATVLADAFKCGLPESWNVLGDRCINISIYLNSVGTIDIASDIGLIVLPFWLFGDLQMKLSNKVVVIIAFSCRIIVVIAAICRLVYLNLAPSLEELLLQSTEFYVCMQIQLCLSVVVASAPAVRIFPDRYGNTQHKHQTPSGPQNTIVFNRSSHRAPQLPRYSWNVGTTLYELKLSSDRTKSQQGSATIIEASMTSTDIEQERSRRDRKPLSLDDQSDSNA